MVPDQSKLPPNKASQPATLLFLPGTLCDARLWEAQRHALSAAWPCVVADYRYEESIFAMASVALACASGPIIPIGFSMGGMVALEIWRQASSRVAGIALFDTNPGADTAERRVIRDAQLIAARQGRLGEMVKTQLIPTYFSPANATNDKLHATVIDMAIDHGPAAFAAQANALSARADSWQLIETINVPALVAYGVDDLICPEENQHRIAQLLSMGTFHTIRGAGHFAPLEQPEATTSVLRDWLLRLH